MSDLEIHMVPRDLYYHETKYVRDLEAKVERMRTALEKIAAECSTFPIKDGLAFRCESIARNVLQ
jgi:hypothetical protein